MQEKFRWQRSGSAAMSAMLAMITFSLIYLSWINQENQRAKIIQSEIRYYAFREWLLQQKMAGKE